MKKKGFTLIELVVVVAIILLLAATLAPKLRKEVAKAKDAKAVAALGSIRTAVNIFYSDKGETPTGLVGTSADAYLFDSTKDTSEYFEKDLVTFLKTDGASTNTGNVAGAPIGARRDAAADDPLKYGGYIVYNYTNTDDLEVKILAADDAPADATSADDLYDTKGNLWSEY